MGKLARRLRSGAVVVTAGQVANQGFVFLRTVVVVRALSQSDYGIASTFLLAVLLLEMGTDPNLAKFLVQAPDGDEPRFQRAAQLARFLQGLLAALLLFALAPFVAALFHLPEYLWAYRTLALVPLLNGLVHLDAHRFERAGRFLPGVLARSGGQGLALVAVGLLLLARRDPTVVLGSLLALALGSTALSHLVAERPYRWARLAEYRARFVAFGGPLVLNGLLLLLILQGDRVLIGASESLTSWWRAHGAELAVSGDVLSKADLAVFSIALSMTFLAGDFALQSFGTLVYPVLARHQEDRCAFLETYRGAAVVFATWGALLGGGFLLAGGAVVVAIYAEPYRSVEPIIGWLGLAQLLRVLRLTATVGALALASTRIAMWGSCARASTLLGSLAVVASGKGLPWIAGCAVVGELLALVATLALVRRAHDLPWTRTAGPMLFALASLGLALGLHVMVRGHGDGTHLLVAVLYALGVASAALWLFRDPLQRLRVRLRPSASASSG